MLVFSMTAHADDAYVNKLERAYIEQLEQQISAMQKQVQELEFLAHIRGVRMKILRDWMIIEPGICWHYLVQDVGNAPNWYNEHGVAK